MTKQEAYERVRAYLTRPGARRAFDPTPTSTFVEGICRYETVIDGETHRCAVGCLLSEKDLDRSMASYVGAVEELFEEYGIPDYLLDIVIEDEEKYHSRFSFLEALQSAHDRVTNWTDEGFHVRALDEVAERYGLTVVS